MCQEHIAMTETPSTVTPWSHIQKNIKYWLTKLRQICIVCTSQWPSKETCKPRPPPTHPNKHPKTLTHLCGPSATAHQLAGFGPRGGEWPWAIDDSNAGLWRARTPNSEKDWSSLVAETSAMTATSVSSVCRYKRSCYHLQLSREKSINDTI